MQRNLFKIKHSAGASDHTADKKLFHRCLTFTVIVFFFALISGGVTASLVPDLTTSVIGKILTGMGDLARQEGFELFISLFLHNLLIAFILFLSGFFFGLVPLFIIFLNGYVIGLVLEYAAFHHGIAVTLAGIIPHGIFEIPAILMASALGLFFGVNVFQKFFEKRSIRLRSKLALGGELFILYVIPLLFIAALIESFITGDIIGMVQVYS